MLPSIHTIVELRGSPRQCGRDYGDRHAELLRVFLKTIIKPDAQRLRYARRCWKIFSQWERPIIGFVRGMAEGSGLSLDEIMSIQLHEEYLHLPHCTAVGVTGAATRDGSAIIAQSWDGNPALYASVALLRIHTNAAPAMFTYSLPGLWASAGINEHGLALVWTSSGIWPKVRPREGVPTFALIAGILGCRNCDSALKLIRRTRNAGCFIFFLADAAGELCVLEGIPGQIEVERGRELITRANHYQCAGLCRAAQQKLPRVTLKWNSQPRAKRMAELAERSYGRIDGRIIETIYRDHEPEQGLGICLHAAPGPYLTLDSFYAVPSKREFWIARGYVCRHRFTRYRV